MTNLSINPQITKICAEHDLDSEIIILVLLAHYFNTVPESFKTVYEEEIKVVHFLGIIALDDSFTNITKWNIPLFEKEIVEDDWSWVITEFREMFKKRKYDAGGTVASCLDKMKKFFAKNPSVRKDDVIEAAKLYIKSTPDVRFLQKASYFINKNQHESRLSEYLEILKKMKEKKAVSEPDKYSKLH